MKTTNYYNTFIEVAEDCPATKGEVPAVKAENKTVASIQYELLMNKPYEYTSDDILFAVYASKNNMTEQEKQVEREKFFSKSQACLRASALPKRYGWGIHFNSEGKIGLYGFNSDEYKKFLEDDSVKHLKAMRSSRVK
ncbi:DUF6157 family protein [Desertivirga arenae]|uniref:DUF6157 family protein n=1 Tax=Desertivirga arenae TaxID=2810309 RepID=UPI001A959752|nr:DUF6157 family protein [Pedobacter sp. SYSU D00823]